MGSVVTDVGKMRGCTLCSTRVLTGGGTKQIQLQKTSKTAYLIHGLHQTHFELKDLFHGRCVSDEFHNNISTVLVHVHYPPYLVSPAIQPTQDIKPATSRLSGPLRPHSKSMNGSYIATSPIHWDNGPTEAYKLYLYFHILGVSFLLCPLLYSVSQTIIQAYNRLRLRSKEFESSFGDSTFDRGPLAEAQGR